MKKLIYVLALVGMLIGCSKNTNAPANEPETEVESETNVETVAENKTEEPWIALIEKEIVEVSFNNGEYKIIPTDKEDYFEISIKLDKGLIFSATLKRKNDTNLYFMEDISPEMFQEKAKTVLSISVLPQYLGHANWAVQIGGCKFEHGIWLSRFDPGVSLFQSSYYTTTPMYTLECTFYKNPCDEFKQEVPQYFEKGGWKMEMPSGKTGDIEFARKMFNGTIESKTARELYRISQEFMKTIEIKTVE